MPEAKFLQIAVGAVPGASSSVTTLYALDADGRVWIYDQTKAQWRALPEQRAAIEPVASGQGIDEPAGTAPDRARGQGRIDPSSHGRPRR